MCSIQLEFFFMWAEQNRLTYNVLELVWKQYQICILYLPGAFKYLRLNDLRLYISYGEA